MNPLNITNVPPVFGKKIFTVPWTTREAVCIIGLIFSHLPFAKGEQGGFLEAHFRGKCHLFQSAKVLRFYKDHLSEICFRTLRVLRMARHPLETKMFSNFNKEAGFFSQKK